MKVLLYFENENLIKKSGIGRALEHQKRACELNGIEYTLDPRDKYDIAHINTYYSNSIALAKKCKKKGIPVIVHGHSTKEDFANSFKGWKFFKPFVFRSLEKLYSKPDLIITPTPYSKRLIENYDFVKCPVINISNGIDIKKYRDAVVTEEDIKNLRNEFRIGDSKIVMGIGWMFERKGFHDFIAFAKHFPDVKFIWFGEYNRLTNTTMINEAIDNKTDNVLLPGYTPQEKIIKFLHFADCFLFPSYEETEGIVLLEALACKCPMIVRDIGAFDYLVSEKECLKAKTNDEFVEKIEYILSHDNTDMVNAGFDVAYERRLANVGAKLKAAYESVLKK